jgi:hypothetical protein
MWPDRPSYYLFRALWPALKLAGWGWGGGLSWLRVVNTYTHAGGPGGGLCLPGYIVCVSVCERNKGRKEKQKEHKRKGWRERGDTTVSESIRQVNSKKNVFEVTMRIRYTCTVVE